MTVRLKETANLVTSCAASRTRPFVALEFLETGTGRLVSDVELLERTAPETGAASVEPGDVLFGKLRPYLAKTWLADRPVFASTELLCLRPRASVDSRWLAYLVASNPVVEWAVATSDGTKMPRTSWEKLAEYRIDIPPTDEQRAIADYLDREIARIDALIEKKQRMLDLLRERRQALITEAVQGEIGPETVARGGGVKTVPLKRVVALTAGQSPPSADVMDSSGEGLPFLQGNAEFGRYHPQPLKRCDSAPRHARPQDILVSIRAPVGALNIADREYGIGRGLCAVCPVSIDQRFCWWLLHAAIPTLASMAVGSTYDAVTGEDVGSLPVPSWSEATQRAIANYLDRETARIDALVEKTDHQIELLREHRQALITVAVTGELQIQGVAA